MNVFAIVAAIVFVMLVTVFVILAIKRVKKAENETKDAIQRAERYRVEANVRSEKILELRERVDKQKTPNEFELAGLKALAHLAENAVMDDVKLQAATLLTYGPPPVTGRLEDRLALRYNHL